MTVSEKNNQGAVYCQHVYKNTGAVYCPWCGALTRETNWAEVIEQHRAWKEWVKDNPQEYTWWSI